MTSPNRDQTTKKRKHNSPDVDEHFISQCFSRLTHDDGSPDVSLRKANLHHLVQAISPWELIHLRSLIQETAPKLSKLAGLPDLPEEIVATISADLDFQDVLNCINVSKAWRRAWTADMVAGDVARVRFPGLVELHPDVSPWSLLRPIAAKTIARAQGRHISSLSITTGRSPLLDCTALKPDDRTLEFARNHTHPSGPVAPGSYAYCAGKIAWQWDPYTFLIDDIRSMTRTLVLPPDLVVRGDMDFSVSGLSSKLLVLGNNKTQRSLIVYHLEKNQYRRVTLPFCTPLHRIYIHQETFLLFRDSYCHAWRWEGGLIRLETPDPYRHENPCPPRYSGDSPPLHSVQENNTPIFPVLICHPTKSSIFYAASGSLFCYAGSSSNKGEGKTLQTLLMNVEKFDRKKWLQTLEYKIHLPELAQRNLCSISCKPANAYGLCSLSVCFESPSFSVVDSEAPGARSARIPNIIFTRINFNAFTETFSTTTQELKGMRHPLWHPDFLDYDEDICGVIWNDLIYYMQNHTGEAREINNNYDDEPTNWKMGGKLLGFRSLCITDKSSTQVINEDSPWFGADEGRRIEGRVTNKPDKSVRHDLAVDDDFLVALSDKGYDVWNYGHLELREEPWVRSRGPAWRLRLTTQDTPCPVDGCHIPAYSGSHDHEGDEAELGNSGSFSCSTVDDRARDPIKAVFGMNKKS
ncbi:hypothetical protein LX36DRAFT_73381 [Colletotrichum falcatum]|nr:hypothetical protein LX36DRAFT_73381 [Colletotrichum falcatum]